MSDNAEKFASWFLAFAFVAAISCLSALAWLGVHTLSDRRPNVPPARTVTACSGCGSEWESAGPTKPITTCPNCPLSDEEWERLKKQIRERKAGGGE